MQNPREERQTGAAGSPAPNTVSAEYTDLVSALRCTISTGLFKLEFLPSSHVLPHGSNVLVEDRIIAIPKKTIKIAFITARNLFFNNVPDVDTRLLEKEMAVLDASAVMLLLAPEHLMAANARKRIILAWEKISKEVSRNRINMDLWMLDSMFTSSLNKHTKSPTLWAHRRWLIQRLPSLEPSRKEREISLIALTAANMHARNYSAWGYLRWWIAINPNLLEDFGHFSPQISSRSDIIPFGLPRLADSIHQWCMNHPSDTSGWSFLTWLLTRPDTAASTTLRLRGPFITICGSVLRWTRSLKLRNESLWVFLRTVMASNDMPEEIRQAFINDCTAIVESDAERTKSRLIAQSALGWLRRQREERRYI